MAELIKRNATEADYNAPSRSIQFKFDIYFNGLSAEPLEVVKDNYLIDCDVLEEACADTTNPFGEVSANEISLTIYNESGAFNPTNTGSPYYGLIRIGVPIKAYVRPEVPGADVSWDDLGTFYVTDWTATITGSSAYITACDKLYDVFSLPQAKMEVTANTSMKDLFKAFFKTVGVDAEIDERLAEELIYAYSTSANAKFLNDLSVGAQAFVYCNRAGTPTVRYAREAQPIAHTLKDTDQIISISSKQSALLEYDSTEVTMHEPQQTTEDVLLHINDIIVPPGITRSDVVSFSEVPVVKITKAAVVGNGKARVEKVKATCMDVTFDVANNADTSFAGSLSLYGTCLETVASTFASTGNNPLKIDNIYIQKRAYAEKFQRFLHAYITNRVPVLELTIRGNPKYLPGDKLHIVSEKYNINYTGILIRQQFKYAGGLSSTIKVFNSQILEVS